MTVGQFQPSSPLDPTALVDGADHAVNNAPPGGPSRETVHRAISTAYYAVFHAINASNAIVQHGVPTNLLVAFGVDPAAYRETNGYVISEQGKPPDLVLEIASEATGHIDVGEKREFYQRLLIPEYWRFDATGEFHGARLAGDRLVNGRYEPIDVAQLAAEIWQGHSEALNVDWRWDHGRLGCHDPATGLHIATFDSERARADAAEARIRELKQRLLHQAY